MLRGMRLPFAHVLLVWALHPGSLRVRAESEPLPGRVVYVAPNASEETGDGSLARPFTLASARRSLSGKAAGVTVTLRGGDYHVSTPFVLTGADSGRPGAPVTYQSFPGERARLTGGVEIPRSLFSPVPPPVAARLRPAADGLQVADLRALGVRNASMLGGSTEISRLKAELFVDDGGHAGLRPALLSQVCVCVCVCVCVPPSLPPSRSVCACVCDRSIDRASERASESLCLSVAGPNAAG